MKFHKFMPLFFFLSFCLVSILPPVNLTHAGINEWTPIGPEGTETYAIVINPKNPSILYVATGKGIFKSTDGGGNWNIISDLRFDVSLAINPINPDVIYAADCLGVYQSTDGGINWSPVDVCISLNGTINIVTINSADPNVVYVFNNCGWFKSTDGGIKWARWSPGIPSFPNYYPTLAFDPVNPNIIYAGTSDGMYKTVDGGANWTFLNGLPLASGWTIGISQSNPDVTYVSDSYDLYKSVDGGANWILSNGLPAGEPTAIAVDPHNPDIVYVDLSYGGGLLKSTDGGATWTPVNIGAYVLSIDPVNPNNIYAGRGNGVFKSEDGGSHWNFLQVGLESTWSLAVDPANPDIIYAGTRNILKSTDGGSNWNLVGLLGSYVRALAVNHLDPNVLYAGVDSSGIVKSSDGGTHWSSAGLNRFTRALAIDPVNPDYVYAGTAEGTFKSTGGGTNWTAINNGLGNVDVLSLAINPENPNIIYAGTYYAGIFRSIDGGANWSSSGLSNNYIISSLVIDPFNPNILYAGSWNGGVFKSTDGGGNWNRVNTGLTTTDISTLVIDPLNPNIIYAGTLEKGVFKSTNRGASWFAVNNGLTDLSVRALAIDPSDPRIVYAGTDGGLFKIQFIEVELISPNGGETLAAGSTQTIRWTYSGNPGSYLKIELLKGGVLNRTITSSVSKGTGGSGSYDWTISSNQAPGTDYRIRVTSTNGAYTDTSDSDFTIAAPTITIVSPNSGETWPAGSRQTIRWSYTGNPGAYVKIELLKGGVVNRVIRSLASKGTGGTGSCNWTIPANLPPGTVYKIRVTSTTDEGYTDMSDSDFTIAAPTITVVSPNSGEAWTAGSRQTIRWNYTGNPGPYVKIELLKGGMVTRTIAWSALKGSRGSGSRRWKVPLNQALGADYSICVTSTSNNSYSDISDSNFTISK